MEQSGGRSLVHGEDSFFFSSEDTVTMKFQCPHPLNAQRLLVISRRCNSDPQRQQQKLECNANVSSLTLEVNVTCDIPYSRNVTPVIDCHSTRVFHEQMSVAYQEKSIFSFRKEFKNNDGIPVIKCYLYYATPGQPRSTASPPAMDLPVKVNVIRPAENGEWHLGNEKTENLS